MQIRMDEKGRILFMATYVISDIHGEYERFMELLEEIELKDTDTLYVLGDVLDRGEHPIKVILKLMEMPNAFCIVGNHEVMALECLRFLCQEITDLAIEKVDAELLDNLVRWKYNGGDATIREFRALDPEMREEVLNFLEDFSLYEELAVGETVSAGAWRAGWIHTGKEDRGIFPARSCMGQTRLSEGILCGYKSGNRTYTDADDSGK